MKKLFLLLFYIFALPVFAKNDYINQAQCRQYKADVRNMLNFKIPELKKETDDMFFEIQNEKNPFIKPALIDEGISSIQLKLYIELEKITEKYANIEKNIPHTGRYEEIQKIIDPYMKDCRINTRKIDDFSKYVIKKQSWLNNPRPARF